MNTVTVAKQIIDSFTGDEGAPITQEEIEVPSDEAKVAKPNKQGRRKR
jgi:hypothetical protein